MARPRFRVWITKYALTQGIFFRYAEHCVDISEDMISVPGTLENYHGNDWHRSFAEASIRAEEMRAKKIELLEKQIRKLRKLSFLEPRP